MKKVLSMLLACLMVAGLVPASALADSGSNVITNVQGINDYIGTGGDTTLTMSTNEDWAIEATVLVSKNADGQVDESQRISSQADVVGTVIYWPDNYVDLGRNGKIVSSNLELYRRREYGATISSSNLMGTYTWSEARDRTIPPDMPSPVTSGADAFGAWTQVPENAKLVIDDATAARVGSTGQADAAIWLNLFNSYKSYYTDIPKIQPS